MKELTELKGRIIYFFQDGGIVTGEVDQVVHKTEHTKYPYQIHFKWSTDSEYRKILRTSYTHSLSIDEFNSIIIVPN